jgi:CubicO group peptidase (beta-lactamase class C family)
VTSLRRYVLDGCRPHNLVQPPGVGFSYSNLGYALVGQLIATITGMRWQDATESILLRPLGIAPVFLDDRPPSRQVAAGHSVNVAVGRTRPVQQPLAVAHAPAGGLAASAMDLVKLALLHVPPGVPDLLPPADAARMRRRAAGAEPFGLADAWAMGLAVFGRDGSTWFGHDGNGNGTACYFRVNPSSGDAVALTSNSTTGYHLWQELLEELDGRLGVPIGPHSARVSSRSIRPPAACLGSYRNGDVDYTVSAAGGNHLRLVVDGDVFPGITCHDDLTFSLPDPASTRHVLYGRFVRDEHTGNVDAIQLSGRTAWRRSDRPREMGRRLTA